MDQYQAFEKAFAQYIGVRDCITTNTGTAALHLAIEGRHYPPGAEIIVPEFTMIATALAPYYARCQPVYVDCSPTMNIDSSLIEASISENTKAIIVTHIYGRVSDMESIVSICEKYGLDLIEDCAEIHGATYHDGTKAGHRVGSLGISCFSFYRNKIVHAQEGGAVCVSKDEVYSEHLRDLKSMSFGKCHNYIHEHVGFNYRMPDCQASLALASLAESKQHLSHRKSVESWYDQALDKRFIRESRDVVWVYDINCPEPETLVARLNKAGIAARRCFAPMSMQPCLGVREGFEKLQAYQIYQSTCYLPVTDQISRQEVEEISDLVNRYG